MSVYLQYKSIYTDQFAFCANDITVTEPAFDIYKKHVANGNIIGWGKEDFPETLTKVITIEYVDSDARDAHINEVQASVQESDAAVDWATNINHRLTDNI